MLEPSQLLGREKGRHSSRAVPPYSLKRAIGTHKIGIREREQPKVSKSDSVSSSVQIQDSRRFSFFIIDNEIVDNYSLSSNAILAYVSIARCAKNGICSFSTKYLAKQVGICRATFCKVLPELVAAELISIGSTLGEMSVYTLLPVKKNLSTTQTPLSKLQTPPVCDTDTPVSTTQTHKNTNNKTEDNTYTLAPPEPTKKRRSRNEIFEPFSDEAKSVVNRVLEIWPHKRSGNNSKIQPDLALLANRVDELLKNPQLNSHLLIRAAERYLAEPREFPHAPEFFFGPGKTGGDGPPWKHYARLEWYEQNKAKTMTAAAGVQ